MHWKSERTGSRVSQVGSRSCSPTQSASLPEVCALPVSDAAEYFARYGLTPARLARARSDAIVLHPQPMNRGIEIASEVADGPQSVIRAQVTNGVAVRMAVLEIVASRHAA